MTSNQEYAAINRRFDKRIKFLKRFGFRYRIEYPFGQPHGYLVRKCPFFHNRHQVIDASYIMLATPRVWREELRQHLRHSPF